MFDTHHILIVLQLFLSLVPDLGVTKQELDFHSDLSSTLHKKYMTRVALRKKQEEPAIAPLLDSGSIPELLNCVVDPKVPLRSDEQQSIKSCLKNWFQSQ